MAYRSALVLHKSGFRRGSAQEEQSTELCHRTSNHRHKSDHRFCTGRQNIMKCRRTRRKCKAWAIAAFSSLATPSGTAAFQLHCRPATFLHSCSKHGPRRKRPAFTKAHDARDIDLQSDASKYGRGEEHITFDLRPGDVVVYQQGTWYVDGVAVGPGDDPSWSYAMVDGLQVVWTHNCEHGVVRGWHLNLLVHDDNDNSEDGTSCNSGDSSGGTILRRNGAEEEVEFGPEQVIGRINNISWDDDMLIGTTPIPLNDAIWRRAAEEQY